MKEDFLQYLWKFQQWTSKTLTTQDGRSINVVDPGTQNFDAGPDFLNAKVRIDETLWAGNVEVHITASDWFKHNHQHDRAYDNVILHVVYTFDKDVKNHHGEVIPALEILNCIDYQSYRYYNSWLASAKYIPCANQAHEVPKLIKMDAVQNAAISRIQKKAELFLDSFNQTQGDIEAGFYRGLMLAFGMKVNAMPFEQLSKIVPIKLVRQHWGDSFQLEALFLGQAGFLHDESQDEYGKKLKREFEFMSHKYDLTPMPKSAWKFFRLRPQNFPTIRLVQLAEIYAREKALAQRIIETNSLDKLRVFFQAEIRDGFWFNHYTLENQSEERPKGLGVASIDVIVINAVVPFLFALAAYNKDDIFKEKGFSFLEEMKGEKNTHIKKFIGMGFPVGNAMESQGVLGLYATFCKQLKCLNCKVGIHLLRNHG